MTSTKQKDESSVRSEKPRTSAKKKRVKRPEPQVPAVIPKIESRLANAEDELQGERDALSLRDRLERDLEEMELRIKIPNYKDDKYGDSFDPVLEYMVSRYRHRTVSHRRFESALGKLRGELRKYKQVLGDLIPRDLRYKAERVMADDHDYDANRNPSADFEMDVYLEGLQEECDRQRKFNGIATGLPKLDQAVNGLEGLTVIGGDPDAGMRTLALNASLAALRDNDRVAVLLYSLGMSKQRTYDSLMCIESGLTYRELTDDEHWGSLEETLDGLWCQPILHRLRVLDRKVFRNRNVSPGELIMRHIKSLLKTSKATHVLTVVDSLQDIWVPEYVEPGCASDHYRLDVVSGVQSRTKCAQHPNGFPVLAISRTQGADDQRKKLVIDDLPGAQHLASRASTILLMRRGPSGDASDIDDSSVPIVIDVTGGDGVRCGEISVSFDPEHYKFTDQPPAIAHGN